MFIYPVSLQVDSNATLLVTFADIPEANSVGDSEQDALRHAHDSLESALELYVDARLPVPLPSALKRGQQGVMLSALATSKILLWNEMLRQNLRKAELARLLDVHMPQIDRLFDLRHSSKISFVEAAAKVLGKRIDIRLA